MKKPVGDMGDDDDVALIAAERQRVQAAIARLEEEDRALFVRQQALRERDRTPAEATAYEEAYYVHPEHAELEQPPDRFWGMDKVALVSYPRSGNSLLRTVVEKLSQTVTGSDGRPDRPLVRQLVAHGLRGEGVMDSRVWCVKTHYPERVGRARLAVTRAILVVRNPFDSISSFFQMMLTDSHTQGVSAEEVRLQYGDLWRDFLFEELSIWMQFNTQWRSTKAPVLVIRYEDLVQHRTKTLVKIADFLFTPFYEKKIIYKPDIEARIEAISSLKQAEVGPYTPKENFSMSTTTSESQENCAATETSLKDTEMKSNINIDNRPLAIDWDPIDPSKPGYLKSLDYFTHEQYRYVLAAARSDLVRYGYWDACMKARPEHAPDLVPYIDVEPGNCMISSEHEIKLNSKYALRPRNEKDPYGRGFDVRWGSRLNALPKPTALSSSPKKD